MNRLSKLVGHYRQQQNLNFEELAGLCGLNPKKWGHRIVDFERESVGSGELAGKLICALNIPQGEVEDAVEKDLADWNQWADEPIPMQMIVRLIGPFCMIHHIPAEINTREAAITYAQNYSMKNHLRVCLALSRRESAWISVDGHTFISQSQPGGINVPYGSFGGTKKFLVDITNGGFRPTAIRTVQSSVSPILPGWRS
jgi:hypothetical protein